MSITFNNHLITVFTFPSDLYTFAALAAFLPLHQLHISRNVRLRGVDSTILQLELGSQDLLDEVLEKKNMKSEGLFCGFFMGRIL